MKAIGELDRTLAFLGLFVALPVTIWLLVSGLPVMYAIAVILSLLACLGYLLLRKHLSLSAASLPAQIESNSRLYLVLNILFLLLLSYSLLSIHLRPETYVRPLGYFISVALMATVVAVEIFFLPPRKRCTYLALFKIILIALSLEWSQLLIFPSIVGSDPWWHEWFTLEILSAGHIPPGEYYSGIPALHLIIGATRLITDLNYKMASMLSISLLQVISDTLFIYLLGRFIFGPEFGTKIGLLSVLLLGVASRHIAFGYFAIPNTLGVTLIPPIIYLLFKIGKERPAVGVSLSILLMATLLLTHTLSSVFLVVLLLVFWGGFKAYKRLSYEKFAAPVTVTTVSLFIVGMFAWWMYISRHLITLARLIQGMFTLHAPAAAQSMSAVPLSEQLFNNLGMFLFFALSFIGCLCMISKKFSNRYGFVLVWGGIILLAIGFFSPILGRYTVAGRWWYTSQVLLAIPLSVTLFLLCGLFKNKLMKVFPLVMLLPLLSFLMIMSPPANMDNRTFSPNTVIRYAFTESEMQAADTMSTIWDGRKGTDKFYGETVFQLQRGISTQSITEELITRDFSHRKGMLIIIRDEIVEHPSAAYFPRTLRLDYDPYQLLADQGFSRIYDNGAVRGLVKQ